MGARADRVIARARAVEGNVVVFAHGHVLRVLVMRWLDLPVTTGQHFLLDTATLGVLGYYHEIPAVRIWNAPLTVEKPPIPTTPRAPIRRSEGRRAEAGGPPYLASATARL